MGPSYLRLILADIPESAQVLYVSRGDDVGVFPGDDGF